MDQSFSIQVLIFLTAAVFVVPLSKKLGLGSVLGYLIAGICIGPYALELVGGREGDSLMHFAEIGVVMMMFIIGLGIDPQSLWRLRKAIGGLGALQVGLTTLVVTFILFYFFKLPFNQSLAIGMIVSLSSTAIVMQTMTENHWLKTEAGKNSFSVLLFQDIAVIPILAILPLLSSTQTQDINGVEKAAFLQELAPWLRTLVVLGSIAVIVVGGKYLTRPIFKMVASTNMNELFNAVALLIVFTITVLMSYVGLSPALGVFLAGVVLANSEYRHELESSIEPFKALFLGLFFIAVGVSIDFDLIAHKPVLILASVLVVMVLKLLILAVLGHWFHMSRKQYLLFAFALAQIGEFGFVLLTFANNQQIFDTNLFNILMAMVAVSMALSPIFMLVFEKVIYRRFSQNKEVRGEYDSEGTWESSEVIIAGYGRFGSVVGRFLKANGQKVTVLDSDSDRVESLRKIGIKVYYGDALQVNLLKSAGANTAKIIVIALDERDEVLKLVKIVKKEFPNLQIYARAYDLEDTYNLMEEGILHIYRETLDTSIRIGADIIKFLGVKNERADNAAKIFFKHDENVLKALASKRYNQKEYMDVLRLRNKQLQELIDKNGDEELKPKESS